MNRGIFKDTPREDVEVPVKKEIIIGQENFGDCPKSALWQALYLYVMKSGKLKLQQNTVCYLH